MNIAEQIRCSDCQRCPDLVAVRKQIVVARGNPGADTLIVGQNPGADEDACGYPFTGRAGKALDSIIRSLNFEPDKDFYFTNAVMCHTEDNATPQQYHIQNCSSNLEQILQSFQKIITVGKPAYLGVMNILAPAQVGRLSMTSMTKMLTNGVAGRYDWRDKSRYVYATYHPAYLIRGNVRTLRDGSIDPNDFNNPLLGNVRSEIRMAKMHKMTEHSQMTVGSLF